jgi:hypothetical protein
MPNHCPSKHRQNPIPESLNSGFVLEQEGNTRRKKEGKKKGKKIILAAVTPCPDSVPRPKSGHLRLGPMSITLMRK